MDKQTADRPEAMENRRQAHEAPSAGTGDAQLDKPRRPFWTRRTVIVTGSILLGGLFFLGLQQLGRSITHESTDDAFLDGDIIAIAPRISGQIKAVYVEQHRPVKAGELLLEVDPQDYEVQLTQKNAALAAADANISVIKATFQLLETQVQAAEATAKQSEAEAAADQAKADKAKADLQRAEDLFRRNIIAPQEFDSARAADSAAEATANAGKQKAASDRSKVAAAEAQLEAGHKAFDRAVAQSNQSRADVQQAELSLSYTKVTAPQNGWVARKNVEQGDYVQAGQSMMALVLERLWVTANFKETQLRKIRIGQPVEISIDSLKEGPFRGHVESIQPGSGAAFSLLPPENAVGNFVKVVQRVSVRIFFDAPPRAEHVLGPGLSVVPDVRVRSFEIPDLLVALIAAVLAVAAGWFWRRFAIRKSAV